MNTFIKTFKIIALATVLSFGISYVYAWTAPTVTPPGGNTSAPINLSSNSQVKTGNITVNALGIVSTASNALSVLGGGVFSGKVTTASTVVGDTGTTLTTKDYVDGKVGSGGGWVNVPLTDTNPFDTSCQYRVDATGNYGRITHYGTMVPANISPSSGNIVYFNGHEGSGYVVWGWIYSTSKGTDSSSGYLGSVNSMQKNCGGLGSGGGSCPAGQVVIGINTNGSPQCIPGMLYGGFYTTPSLYCGAINNPMTGGLSCPNGYTPVQAFGALCNASDPSVRFFMVCTR